jgi:hypothetical protein
MKGMGALLPVDRSPVVASNSRLGRKNPADRPTPSDGGAIRGDLAA